jgi:hypothetical protein
MCPNLDARTPPARKGIARQRGALSRSGPGRRPGRVRDYPATAPNTSPLKIAPPMPSAT